MFLWPCSRTHIDLEGNSTLLPLLRGTEMSATRPGCKFWLQIRSQLYLAVEVRLLDKPHIHGFPVFIWFSKLEVEIANELRNKFGHLQEADILADACSGSHSKLLRVRRHSKHDTEANLRKRSICPWHCNDLYRRAISQAGRQKHQVQTHPCLHEQPKS